MMDRNTYWLTLAPSELGPAVADRFKKYLEEIDRRGLLSKAREATIRYYNAGGSVLFGGEAGEVVLVKVNHFRSLVTNILAMTTSERLAFEASATDDTAQSAAQVQLAQQILDAELDAGLEVELSGGGGAAWRMLVQGEGAVAVTWDATAGEIIGAEPVLDELGQQTGEVPVYEGALQVESFSAYDVARDLGAKSLRTLPWVIVRRRMSRWDLLAQYPEAETEILGEPHCAQVDQRWGGLAYSGEESTASVQSDQIYVLDLFAAKTRAMPRGRFARVVGERYLMGGDLPYRRVPVVIRSPDEIADRAMGSTTAWDLLGVAEMIDSAESSMASVSDAYGTNIILEPEGADLDVTPIDPALKRARYKPIPEAEPPRMLEQRGVTPSQIDYAGHLIQQAGALSGVNSSVRGEDESSGRSGAFLAMRQATAVQYLSRFQGSYTDLVEEVATRVVECYQTFAKSERLIDVTGTDEAVVAKRFTGEDIASVRRVRVKLGNPVMRTIAGKMEVADKIFDPQLFPEPLTREQYIGFLTTGRYDPITRSLRSSSIAIKAEGEALLRGEPVTALATDHHAAHIREHAALLDGRARMGLDEAVIAAVSAHIAEHGEQWTLLTQTNPALLAATGQQPAPMAMMPGAPGPGGEPPPSGGPPPGPPGPSEQGPPPPEGGAPAPIAPAGGPSPLPTLPTVPGGGTPPIAGGVA